MRLALFALALFAASLLGACSSVPLNTPPVEQKNFQKIPTPYAPYAPAASPAAPTGIAAAATSPQVGQPGFYTVRPGDTLRRIATQFGTTWQTLAQWNHLSDPNLIEVGQALRVAPPGAGSAAVASAPAPELPASSAAQSFPVATAAPVAPQPAASRPATPQPAAAVAASTPARAQPAPKPAPSPAASAVAHAAAGPVVVANGLHTATNGGIVWSWPAGGRIIAGFNGTTSKGIDIAGNLGDPVYAAAAGRVVYAGSELRGFGKLIIVKHNDDYISVYAHNSVMLVKEGDVVRRAQKIAEMGSTDAPRVELHFEIRLRGKSVDPLGLLPKQNR